MFEAQTQVRVRYAETDQMGFVYYGNYAIYHEVARVECLRQLGFSYKSLEERGIMMPVSESYSRYIRAAKYDDLLTIKVRIEKMPAVKIRFDYEIYNQDEILINTGHTLLFFMNSHSHKPVRLPQDIHDLFVGYFTDGKQ